MSFHTSSPTASGQSHVAQHHSVQQAVPLRLKLWLHFEELSFASNPFVALLSATWSCLCLCVIRFAHWQRSRVLELSSKALHGEASSGKRRTKGRRPPFQWVMPRFGVSGRDIAQQLLSLLKPLSSSDASFLLPDFEPDFRLYATSVESLTNNSRTMFSS